MSNGISKPASQRLIKLVSLLEQLEEEAKVSKKDDIPKTVTSSLIEHRTGWTRDTIRRDISLLGVQCGSSSGYNIQELKEAIKSKLFTQETEKKCCIVGLGTLGAALINFEGFVSSTFVIKVGFDFSMNRTEVLQSHFPLYPMSMLEKIIQREQIDYAILAVSEKDATKTARRLAECGIKGIVNFTNALINLQGQVRVENISVIDALQKVSAKV